MGQGNHKQDCTRCKQSSVVHGWVETKSIKLRIDEKPGTELHAICSSCLTKDEQEARCEQCRRVCISDKNELVHYQVRTWASIPDASFSVFRERDRFRDQIESRRACRDCRNGDLKGMALYKGCGHYDNTSLGRLCNDCQQEYCRVCASYRYCDCFGSGFPSYCHACALKHPIQYTDCCQKVICVHMDQQQRCCKCNTFICRHCQRQGDQCKALDPNNQESIPVQQRPYQWICTPCHNQEHSACRRCRRRGKGMCDGGETCTDCKETGFCSDCVLYDCVHCLLPEDQLKQLYNAVLHQNWTSEKANLPMGPRRCKSCCLLKFVMAPCCESGEDWRCIRTDHERRQKSWWDPIYGCWREQWKRSGGCNGNDDDDKDKESDQHRVIREEVWRRHCCTICRQWAEKDRLKGFACASEDCKNADEEWRVCADPRHSNQADRHPFADRWCCRKWHCPAHTVGYCSLCERWRCTDCQHDCEQTRRQLLLARFPQELILLMSQYASEQWIGSSDSKLVLVAAHAVSATFMTRIPEPTGLFCWICRLPTHTSIYLSAPMISCLGRCGTCTPWDCHVHTTALSRCCRHSWRSSSNNSDIPLTPFARYWCCQRWSCASDSYGFCVACQTWRCRQCPHPCTRNLVELDLYHLWSRYTQNGSSTPSLIVDIILGYLETDPAPMRCCVRPEHGNQPPPAILEYLEQIVAQLVTATDTETDDGLDVPDKSDTE